MKAFYRMFVGVAFLFTAIIICANLYFLKIDNTEGRQYRVDVSRAMAVIESKGIEALDLSEFATLTAVSQIHQNSVEDLIGGNYDYLIREINGRLYRFDYVPGVPNNNTYFYVLNFALGIMALAGLFLMLYMRKYVIKPFVTLSEMPYELSKGNLSVPLKESRQRYFGRFVWGMDMLREKLEQSKRNELDLQADRKKLILSLSHDIKIPLSAIKLYAKAISKGLYDGEERHTEIAERINEKADEIEHYVSAIVTASREDFLSLEVNEGEFYLSEVLDKISLYYSDKLQLLKTEFSIVEYRNCLIGGDCDRAVEVIQNMMENAIKYGDGKRITISVSDEEDCRLVTVSNTGCTLQQSELPHMFDSFWRGSNASEGSGSGLGLYICRCLMNKMGGEVFAEMKADEMCVTAVFRLV